MEQLTERQALSITILFIVGSSIVAGVAKSAKENAWLSLVIAAIVCVPIFIIYIRLLNAYENKNIFEICEIVFGRILGKILIVILIVDIIYNAAIILRVLAEFIYTTGLNETSRMLIITLIISLSVFIVKKGILVYGRWNTIFLVVTITVVMFTSILLFPSSDFNLLRPIMYDGFEPVKKGAISTLAVPMSQVGILLGMTNCINPKASKKKILLLGLLFSTIILLVIIIGDISIIGGNYITIAIFQRICLLED